MKNFPPQLLTWLQTHTVGCRVDLIKIELPNGQTMYALCNCQVDLVYSGNTYRAVQNGLWSRGKITSNIGTQSSTMDLNFIDQNPQVVFPGTSITVIQAASLGLFDGAKVTIYTAYGASGSPALPDLS